MSQPRPGRVVSRWASRFLASSSTFPVLRSAIDIMVMRTVTYVLRSTHLLGAAACPTERTYLFWIRAATRYASGWRQLSRGSDLCSVWRRSCHSRTKAHVFISTSVHQRASPSHGMRVVFLEPSSRRCNQFRDQHLRSDA